MDVPSDRVLRASKRGKRDDDDDDDDGDAVGDSTQASPAKQRKNGAKREAPVDGEEECDEPR